MAKSYLIYEDFTVGWVCALPVERAAAVAMPDDFRVTDPSEGSVYVLGRLGASHGIEIPEARQKDGDSEYSKPMLWKPAE